jgi:hypothetical protein
MECANAPELARVRVPSPALELLRLPVGIWLHALPQHTLRHLAQARRVRGGGGGKGLVDARTFGFAAEDGDHGAGVDDDHRRRPRSS